MFVDSENIDPQRKVGRTISRCALRRETHFGDTVDDRKVTTAVRPESAKKPLGFDSMVGHDGGCETSRAAHHIEGGSSKQQYS